METTNKQTDDSLIEGIMNGLAGEVHQETEVAETEGAEEAKAEAEAKAGQAEEAITESQEGGEGEIQAGAEEQSGPASKNEVNKVEGFKAFRDKLKEKDGVIADLEEKLYGKKEEAETTATQSADDKLFERMGAMFDKSPEEIKAAFKAKDAKDAGMTVEAYEKFMAVNKRMDGYEAEKAEAAKTKTKMELANAIDGFIESTGISNEEDVTKFFVKAKDMGFDLIKNPNSEAMVTVFNGMDKTGFKETLTQDVLMQIKNGEIPDVKSEEQESNKIAQQKQNQEKFNNNKKSWMQQADDM